MLRIIIASLALTACDSGLTEAQRDQAIQIARAVSDDRVGEAEAEIEDATDMAYDHEDRLLALEERLGIE